MNVMECRYNQLIDTVHGYAQSGVPLIAYNDVARFYPSGFGDDPGIYYFIPKLVTWFGVSVETAMNIFFMGTIVLASALGLAGVFRLYEMWRQRFIGIVAIAGLAYYSWANSDVYLFSPCLIVAILPWFLYFCRGRQLTRPLIALLLAASFIISTTNLIRSHAGTGLFLFMIILLLTYVQTAWKRKVIILLLMVMVASIPQLYFRGVVKERNEYLQEHNFQRQSAGLQHPLWHSVYIGLGYIKNPYVEKYLDSVASNTVRSIDPSAGYLSKEYEDILRSETIKIITKDPAFFARNVAAKLWRIIILLAKFANFGLLFTFLYRKPWQLELAFWVAIVFYASAGLLVVPSDGYLTGFMAFSSFYGVVGINHGLTNISICRLIDKLQWRKAI